jgi:hypothetical protein
MGKDSLIKAAAARKEFTGVACQTEVRAREIDAYGVQVRSNM